MEISMDARTNFLTAPATAQRGNDVLAEPSGDEASASGAQFAGVLNGQMLKLERQALASPATESVDLQVLRLGNKLNVITTDAPLPDLASLADFARAQGLGESAVQALFGSVGSGLASISAPISVGTGMPAQATELPDSGNPQAAQALAQTAAASLIQTALTSTHAGAVAGENWLGQRSPISGTADAADAFKASASAVVLGGTSEMPVAPALAADTLNPWSALHALRHRGLTSETAPVAVGPANRLELQGTETAPAALGSANRLELQGTETAPAALGSAAPLEVRSTQLAPSALSPDALAAAALAAAVQAGLGMTALQQATELGESAVTLTSLSIEKSGSSPPASLIDTKAVVPAGAKGTSQASVLLSAVAVAVAVAAEEEVPDKPQADLQIRLLPPDQAITQRLAQMAGKSKAIDWSALLAGQKVSDTLAGLAQSPRPALSDTQAKLVAQMQANGQLPDSGDEARNALLAKLQVQAASAGTAPAGLNAQAGTPALASAAQPQLATGIAPLASQSVGVAAVFPAKDTTPSAPSALAAQGAGAAQALHQARAHSLWESVRIEVPSGLVLEALQEQQAQKSDAEPTVPLSAAAGSTSNLSYSLASDKAQVSTPQALAEQRAAQYQEVADQLGEAMAKRLMAQIERGQWKMQLRMQPAALGRIDVELDMHARGLDATFTSDNAVTRELMAQGSARLRDTLTQTGTTVASVVVNGDSGRQSGGNSTPGRKFKGEQGEKSNKSETAAPVIAAARAASGQGDGLNVLA
jgi:flagellar hook-length control protein FliK